ncbi:MAG TPA: hypothetical protein VM870_09425, partial [Pyrinomonadaceae bacterium]|nr:hypothetical protein [Pyrinomonadaceae bacterium]
MKLFLRLAGVAMTLIIVAAVVNSAVAAAQTPDVFLNQITSGTRDSFTNGVSGDGRFAVIESTGDIATINPDNADANREIFLLDYGQRRIFQLTRTKSPLLTPTPAPTPTPTPTATPTPGAPSTIEVEVSNNKPVISRDGRWIAFSSNAANPASFDGTTAENRAALIADGNQEMFLYQVPAAPAVDLTAGTDVPLTDLAQGTFTRLTDTAASRPTSPGSSTASPFVAFDNRDPALNDDGSLLAFVSTRNLRGGNANFQPEMFIFNRANGALNQLTTSQGNFVFNESPSFSGDGSMLVFVSNATSLNIAGVATLTDTEGNGEIYLVNLTGGGAVAARQVTKTANSTNAATVNFLNPGQRISRNGAYVAFESLANLTGDGAIQTTRAVFIYNVAANTFSQVLARPTTEDVLGFPTFSGDSATLVFSSARNFTATGATPATAAEGLNPNRSTQIFSIPVANALNPVSSQSGFERLTNTPAIPTGFALPLAQAFVTDTRNRLMFAYRGELGGGNADVSSEVFYLLTPGAGGTQTPASANAISYQTGATRRDVTASPTAPAVAALAPGMLGIARSTVQVAPPPPTGTIANSSIANFRPSLPIELNGVSMSINGVAAGLLYVSPDEVQ